MNMTISELRERILELISHINFTYNGKEGVIDPFSDHDFLVGYGDESKEYTSIDDLFSDKFYDGKSLNEICDKIMFD